jgi:hypothetical protein
LLGLQNSVSIDWWCFQIGYGRKIYKSLKTYSHHFSV